MYLDINAKLQKKLFLRFNTVTGVARWFIFTPKNPNVGKFRRVLRWKMLLYLRPFGLFYDHFVYFAAIWDNLWLFGTFFPPLVCCIKKNLATMIVTKKMDAVKPMMISHETQNQK
jgi:hypothetical protein